ncbi:hypothetical protein [Actinosynnema sp. NPDC020468]|uniref:hypothetical protein n=1 Tax=Actinosynnema sp. NPDC020468 TaxID=3154488 RepID=UPI0033CF73B6
MLDRRTFVLGTAATAALVSTAATTASAATPVDRVAGPATTGDTPRALARQGGSWVLVDPSGATLPTTGLTGADVVDATVSGTTAIAVGSLGDEPVAVIWESTDGLAWREVRRLHGVRSAFTAVGPGLALGSVLAHEKAPVTRIAARRSAAGWTTVPARGPEWTDGWSATALASTPEGWIAAAVGVSGTVLHSSRDGVTWSAHSRVDGVAVRALVHTPAGVRWIGNELAGSAPLTGLLGSAPTAAPVPFSAKASGTAGDRFGWLADGRLVTTEVSR